MKVYKLKWTENDDNSSHGWHFGLCMLITLYICTKLEMSQWHISKTSNVLVLVLSLFF